MPDESCRICGGLLLNGLRCENCNGIIQYACIKCANKTQKQYHDGYCINIINVRTHVG